MNNNTHSVTLKDTFSHAACLDARRRIEAVKGVSSVSYLPQGCFGIDVYRMWVDIEPGSNAAEEIRKLAEVRAITKGFVFE